MTRLLLASAATLLLGVALGMAAVINALLYQQRRREWYTADVHE